MDMERLIRNFTLLIVAAACAICLPGSLRAQWSTGSGGTIYYNGGDVGIGTASPSTSLHILGGTLRQETTSINDWNWITVERGGGDELYFGGDGRVHDTEVMKNR
jgi:hypothetical protein